MSSGLYSGTSGLALGTGLYKNQSGLWSGASGLISGAGGAAFNPASALFAAGEQGYWLDPSDFSTMFQDAAGTTPVTAVGQSVRLMLDKSRGLTPGPELVTNGTFDTNVSGWTANASAIVVWDSGRMSVTRVSSANDVAFQSFPTVAGRLYRLSYQATGAQVNCRITTTSVGFLSPFALLPAGTGYFIAQSTTTFIGFGSGTGGPAFYDNISVREIPGNHFTQANVANAPILQVDGTGRHFLLFDGSDDWLQSAATINPGAVDKAQVFAGVRKLSDATSGVVVESSVSFSANVGSFILSGPGSDGAATYNFNARGSTIATPGAVATGISAPVTNVVTGIVDIAAPTRAIRVNGASAASTSAGLGATNFLTYQHFIGRRGGTTLPFNGRLYQLITRYGANLTADQISATETFVNQRTGAY